VKETKDATFEYRNIILPRKEDNDIRTEPYYNYTIKLFYDVLSKKGAVIWFYARGEADDKKVM